MVDFELLKKLIEIVKNEDISGITIEDKGTKYEIRRERGGLVIPTATASETTVNAKNITSDTIKKEDEKNAEEDLIAITSPMVGTFYAAPSPDSPPFVKVGDHVSTGKVVCIIEAMKLFNEIESEISGTVFKILTENGKPVEYGQKLMLIKKG
ncbi:acetyl-CoA carboxylase, biotin carboxyl carrier protein [candidate division WOR-1 bacterium RIFOXYD2_FULL_36_8]|uniref:Biotin carboxyl carrier protein of acetyl-CoA carboxylase n=1 Tax=candidate division WOR-1 bacterium RIFOXYB2_FULL_36_35 TaxID=1802578 RepID=A0A1F4S4Y9_UNCSA|nr:MAG: acetyl-CoA carboxylase, biotin carboxyl carrier protein [candidate division WOR-1 bacterium RIFOXYA2_FULL_36_21]OGC14519.1 MAG: acetyl-CoA carboxylase, biotin carboxyl carrier protein [candidate division WOR-1 bacterium RIFOXYA12_FULL_36_13]OGC15498.1 MAG: acetyl-CoA carboxylase, biotin carboxyl carrier protein [candidate division WOR-1 bacterium RIFOXYB2_FULL_36_35]OGC41225.1 MAG: acetyl-CoA carboxylase, biotin carboxyl carrier protein [candidate division WOR-1 bacterium RIFOXYD2_FULL_3